MSSHCSPLRRAARIADASPTGLRADARVTRPLTKPDLLASSRSGLSFSRMGDQPRATARVARAFGEVTRRVWRRVSSVADLTRPALLRVDLRDGVAPSEISSAGPPLLFERLDRLRCAVPSPLTPAVAASTERSMLCARVFFGFAWLLLTCCSARYRSALVAMPSRITASLRECTRCLLDR